VHGGAILQLSEIFFPANSVYIVIALGNLLSYKHNIVIADHGPD